MIAVFINTNDQWSENLRGHHGIDQLNPLKNSPSFPGPFCLEICPTTDQQKNMDMVLYMHLQLHW